MKLWYIIVPLSLVTSLFSESSDQFFQQRDSRNQFSTSYGNQGFSFLKTNLAKAKPGDYVVTVRQKGITLMHIYSRSHSSVTIEEISVPQHLRPKGETSWREWVSQGAPNHSSWVIYEVDLKTAHIQEFYNFTQHGWQDVSPEDNFLSSLLMLEFDPVSPEDRKRIGIPNNDGFGDSRRFWNPPMRVDGDVIAKVQFDAWNTRWPKDGSELAGKRITVYMPKDDERYPSYFPYWLEVRATVGSAKVRVIDSGRDLESPMLGLPRRPPAFVNNGQYVDGTLQFDILTRPYYKQFRLLATPTDDLFGNSIELFFTIYIKKNQREATIFIDEKELLKHLRANRPYRFTLISKDFPSMATHTDKPLTWKPR